MSDAPPSAAATQATTGPHPGHLPCAWHVR
jgi:hypothetical protein